MKLLKRVGIGSLITAALALGSVSASAAVITFDGLAGPNGTALGTYMEDGFTVTDTSGTWNQAFVFGNPVPSIFTDGAGANTVEVTRTDGGDFILNSVEFACGIGGGQDCDIGVIGLLDGIEQFSVTDLLNTTEVWTTIFPTSAGIVIDQLVLSLDEGDSNIDNIDLSTVPAPATAALLGLGLLGAGFARRRRA